MANDVNPVDQLVVALYVDDLGESLSFYQGLGFTLVRDEGTFMEIRWDETPLFLVEKRGVSTFPPYHCGDLRILVADVDHYWELAQQQGLKIIRPLESRSYGLRDFIISGPGGLALRFAARLSDSDRKEGLQGRRR
jgi:catechol 2,3-dioxygenase-like lactoylglutathione lyase family enzyme